MSVAGPSPAATIVKQRRSTELDPGGHGGADHGRRLHPGLARRERGDPGAHRSVPRPPPRARRRRPPRRPPARPRRRRHDAPAGRAAARHRLRDDHPARRPARQPADALELRRDRGVRRHPVARPTRRPTSPATSGRCSSAARSCCSCRWCPKLGVNINGARIWVRLGPISFQPGEFAKIALAIFFAAYLAERRELIAASTWRLGPFRLPEIQLHRADPRRLGVRRCW